MKRKTRNKMLLCLLTLLVICISVTSAFAGTAWDSLKGSPKKDKSVSVEVKTYTKTDDGKLKLLPDLSRIKAGDDTTYIPVIKNTGNTSNLRIRLYAKNGNKQINILKYCYGYEGEWDKKDGWFYLKTPFKAGGEYRICEGFHFPEDWNWQENNILDVTVDAEAVQDEPAKEDAHKVTSVLTGDTNKTFIWIICTTYLLGVLVGVVLTKLFRKVKGLNARKEE